jgi:hypothetical protein
VDLELLADILGKHSAITRIARSVGPQNELLASDPSVLHVVKMEENVLSGFITNQKPVVLVVLEEFEEACKSFM